MGVLLQNGDYIGGVSQQFVDAVAQKQLISDKYSAQSTYAVGDLCIYNDSLYVCTTAISTPEAWNIAHWHLTTIDEQLKTIDDELKQVKSNLTELEEYSETEQVVGKWTDGKTLYRKVYTCPSFSVTSSSTTQTYTVFTFPSNTNIIKYFCRLNHSTSEYMLPYSNGNKTSSCVGIKGTTPYIQIRVANDGWTSVTVTTEAYYTKNS